MSDILKRNTSQLKMRVGIPQQRIYAAHSKDVLNTVAEPEAVKVVIYGRRIDCWGLAFIRWKTF